MAFGLAGSWTCRVLRLNLVYTVYWAFHKVYGVPLKLKFNRKNPLEKFDVQIDGLELRNLQLVLHDLSYHTHIFRDTISPMN